MWIFTSLISLFVNIGIFLSKSSFSFPDFFGLIGGAFVPFIGLINLIGTDFPIEVTLFIGVITGIVSAIQTYLLISIIANYVPTVNV